MKKNKVPAEHITTNTPIHITGKQISVDGKSISAAQIIAFTDKKIRKQSFMNE